MSCNVVLDTQATRLRSAMARLSILEVELLKRDTTSRRDMRQLGAADAVLLTGALEHRPSERKFDGSKISNVVLTTIAGYKQQIELVLVSQATYKICQDAVAALEAEAPIVEEVTKLIDRAHALVADLDDRIKQRERNMSKKTLPQLTEVQLLEAWNQVCELYQGGAELDDSR